MNGEDQRNKSKDNKKDNSIDEERLTELIREILSSDFGIYPSEEKTEPSNKGNFYTGIIGSNHLEEITEEEFNSNNKGISMLKKYGVVTVYLRFSKILNLRHKTYIAPSSLYKAELNFNGYKLLEAFSFFMYRQLNLNFFLYKDFLFSQLRFLKGL